MIQISQKVAIFDNEVEVTAIRSGGPGGQHVNKVATAIWLRFDIQASSLPDFYKHRLLKKKDRRITKEGVIIIKSQTYRTQHQNKVSAFENLVILIKSVTYIPKIRKPTKPSRAAKLKRLESKKQKGTQKKLRQKKGLFD
ncbi:MAG: aminoacyl-tRNA hydrolase [Deltaproteobacteria bacterium]|jgi:ribosome-associated protein|nr:aminoacyl-tRNA hydrolase [Deltaproteobacteria bacterium]